MTEPADMILPVLREMRAEMASGFATVDARLDKLETSKLVTGEFEERIEALERKVRELESQK
jgi:hypothetical protein